MDFDAGQSARGWIIEYQESSNSSSRFCHVNLKNYLVTRQKLIDRALDRYLPKANRKPTTLHRAMRYSLFAGGKRLRPILCLAAQNLVAARSKMHFRWRARLNASTRTRLCTMIFRAWITMISDAVVRLATRFLAKASPCSRVTLY
jgi:Geranylgeranyl pyrophosphate synthase